MDQATHNKSFNRYVCERQPSRSLAEYTALVSDRLVRGRLPVARAPSSKQIVVTVVTDRRNRATNVRRIGASNRWVNGRPEGVTPMVILQAFEGWI